MLSRVTQSFFNSSLGKHSSSNSITAIEIKPMNTSKLSAHLLLSKHKIRVARLESF